MDTQPASYAIISTAVMFDKQLSFGEKILYTYITALSRKQSCWASNAYFATCFDVSTRTIQNWLEHLRDLGYIRVDFEQKAHDGRSKKRVIIPLVAMRGADTSVQTEDTVKNDVKDFSWRDEQNVLEGVKQVAHSQGTGTPSQIQVISTKNKEQSVLDVKDFSQGEEDNLIGGVKQISHVKQISRVNEQNDMNGMKQVSRPPRNAFHAPHETDFVHNNISKNNISKNIKNNIVELSLDFASPPDSSSSTALTTQPHAEVAQVESDVIPYQQIIDYLNMKAGTAFRASTVNTRKAIKARWRENWRLEDFKKVVDNKCVDWLYNPDMKKYLCPDTLFGTKFEKYWNQQIQPTLKNIAGAFSYPDGKLI